MDEKKVKEAIELIRMGINTLEGIENCGRVIEARKKMKFVVVGLGNKNITLARLVAIVYWKK